MNPVTLQAARSLILWPKGTHGYAQEEAALRILIGLADLIGYGRLPQIAAQLEQLWRDPTLASQFEQQRQAFLALQRTWLHTHSSPPSILIIPSIPSIDTPTDTPTDNETLSVKKED